jgi:hypothetical protein
MKFRNALAAALLAAVCLTGCTPSSGDDAPTSTKPPAGNAETCDPDAGENLTWVTSNSVKLGDSTLSVVVNYDASDVSKRTAEIRFADGGPANTFKLGEKWFVTGVGTLQMTGLRGPSGSTTAQVTFRFWPGIQC